VEKKFFTEQRQLEGLESTVSALEFGAATALCVMHI
jgi:hypothetical protein